MKKRRHHKFFEHIQFFEVFALKKFYKFIEKKKKFAKKINSFDICISFFIWFITIIVKKIIAY